MTKDICDREDPILKVNARVAFRAAIAVLAANRDADDRQKHHRHERHVSIEHEHLQALVDRIEWLESAQDGLTSKTTAWVYESTGERVKFSPVGRPSQCILSRRGTVEIVNQSIIPYSTRQGA